MQLQESIFVIEINKLNSSNFGEKIILESRAFPMLDSTPYIEDIEWSNFEGSDLEVLVHEESNISSITKQEEGKVEVFFATNRNKTGDNDPNLFFGEKLNELSTGKCIINIPKGHKKGEIERPRKILWWQFNENKDKHVTLDSIVEIGIKDFYSMMKKDVIHTKNQSCLLFVHGYNTTFAEAAWRTGQIAYDMPFNGLTGFFSWPSSGRTLDYFSDIEKADSSVDLFEKFISELITKSKIKKLHIVAHSMGNRVVTAALKSLSQKTDLKHQLDSIHQIVLAAPDLDQIVFEQSFLPTLRNLGKSRTLYASDKDKAMRISEKFRSSMPRLGKGGEALFIADGLHSIDASNVRSPGNHHSYIFETETLLKDLYNLFDGVTNPTERNLKQADHQGLKYWYFPF
jgi:esterase/lipase superfamily enzyme